MKSILLLLSVLLASLHLGISCSCNFMSFCDLYGTDFEQEKVIVFLEITSTQEDGVYATYQRATNENLVGIDFFIRSGNGANCIRSTAGLAVGDRFMSIVPYDAGDILPDTVFYSECAENLLKIEGNNLRGAIALASDNYVTETTFGQLSTFEGCEGIRFPLVFEDFVVYPNPSSGDLFLKSEQDASVLGVDVDIEVLVYSMEGQEVARYNWETDNLANVQIPMQQLPEGIYFVKVRALADQQSFKVIKF
ncbi:MAG: T9SS type A sorting domain-containing protein [Bacteroidota bacterium]